MHISLSFPNHILTVPDIRIIGIDSELLKETKKSLAAFDNDNRVCFQFDTTFNLTGYYVSILVYIHPILVKANSDKSPVIPFAYYVHEKKHEKCHDEFWRYVFEIIPEIEELGFIITDCEEAFRKSIRKYFPKLPLLRCWNHFWKSTERWIISNKQMDNEEVGFYCDSLRELFLQPTKNQFDIQLNKKKIGYTNNSGHFIQPWKPEFINYFDKHVMPEINSIAAFSIKPIAKNLFNHFTAITTNHSEGVNNLLKLMQNRNELPLDVILLSFQQLSIYYCNEIKFGFGNRGVYRLRPEYKELCYVNSKYVNTRVSMEPSQILESLLQDKVELLKQCGVQFSTISDSSASDVSDTESLPELSLSKSTPSVQEIPNPLDQDKIGSTSSLDQCEEILDDITSDKEDNSQKTFTISTTTVSSTLKECSLDDTISGLDSLVQSEISLASGSEVSETEIDEPIELRHRFNSKVSRALWMVNNDQIRLDSKLKTYFVSDEHNECYQVKLLPKATCTCLEKQHCCHILAVQSINGIEISNAYKIPNLAKLTKSKNMGSTGRKTRGHAINSIVPMSTDTLASTGTNSNISKVLIMDLISENNHHLIEQILSKKILIKLSMLTNDHRNLCDAFLT